jgi:hypothetical protein
LDVGPAYTSLDRSRSECNIHCCVRRALSLSSETQRNFAEAVASAFFADALASAFFADPSIRRFSARFSPAGTLGKSLCGRARAAGGGRAAAGGRPYAPIKWYNTPWTARAPQFQQQPAAQTIFAEYDFRTFVAAIQLLVVSVGSWRSYRCAGASSGAFHSIAMWRSIRATFHLRNPINNNTLATHSPYNCHA